MVAHLVDKVATKEPSSSPLMVAHVLDKVATKIPPPPGGTCGGQSGN